MSPRRALGLRVAGIALTATFAIVTAAAAESGSVDRLDGPATATETAVRGQRLSIDGPGSPTARFRVTFEVTWTSATHPRTLPAGSHTSPPIVAVHTRPGAMFSPGSLASSGIEAMAEIGATSNLVGELASDPAVATIETGRRIDGPGVDTFEFELEQGERYVSLVSMLAPSPDWFVGVHDVDVMAGGRWADRLEIVLGNYDAGTDSGARFTSANVDTTPAQLIDGPRDAEFSLAAAEGAFGRVVIERIG